MSGLYFNSLDFTGSVTLNYSDVEEVVKCAGAYVKAIDKKTGGFNSNYMNLFICHPNTRGETQWHFGIRALMVKTTWNIVLTYPVYVSIGGVLLSCTHYLAVHHPKYHNR